MVGKFSRTHTLNLDYSTSLTSFHKDCFACMPNLKFLSMCETRIANLWTTTAALSKLPSLLELRFQRRLYYEDIESYIASSSGNEDGRVGPFPEEPMIDIATLVDQNLISETMLNNLMTVANVMVNPELQREGEESSDDSEVDFSSQRQEYGFMHELTAAISEWSGRVDVHDEVMIMYLAFTSYEQHVMVVKRNLVNSSILYLNRKQNQVFTSDFVDLYEENRLLIRCVTVWNFLERYHVVKAKSRI